jgi:hypothetical protein
MLISVESKFATYHHVVVVWREMVIDYESRINSSNALLFWNPLVMASTATEYFQLTAILLIFEFASIR